MNGGIINSITRLHLVGYISWVIPRCTDPWILNCQAYTNQNVYKFQNIKMKVLKVSINTYFYELRSLNSVWHLYENCHIVPLVVGLLYIQNILLLNKRAYKFNIYIFAIGSTSYLILIQQVYLWVYYKYIFYYNRHSYDTLWVSLQFYQECVGTDWDMGCCSPLVCWYWLFGLYV
jgi:hypothetical protein